MIADSDLPLSRGIPGGGRYARLEREQRWLLGSVPDEASVVARIEDHYLTGTTLRLRQMVTEGGVAYKIGQKVRVRPEDPEHVMLTNIYLTAEEHAYLSELPGRSLRKTRYHLDVDGREVAVDRFEGRHAPLVLGEVELADEEPYMPMPGFAVVDVTRDDRYSGGALAEAADEELAELLGGSI